MKFSSLSQLPGRPVLFLYKKASVSKFQLSSVSSPKFETSETKAQTRIHNEVPTSSRIQRQLAGTQLQSTLKHRLLVSGSLGLNFYLLGRGVLHLQPSSLDRALLIFLALYGGYILADFLTGVYHWVVDNYGSKDTPVLGQQIEAFQGHHLYPWTITYRQFCNNIHTICRPAIFFTLGMILGDFHPLIDIFCASGCMFVALCQQFHAWAHTKPSALHPLVLGLQKSGILVSTATHCGHHKHPFDCNYCIVSGAWNPLLDSTGFFHWLEEIVYRQSGTRPRCWEEQGLQNKTEASYLLNKAVLGD